MTATGDRSATMTTPPPADADKKCPFKDSAALVSLAKARCPAFNKGCPFAEATTPDDVPRLLGRMPASHADPSGVVALAVDAETRSRAGSDARSRAGSDGDLSEATRSRAGSDAELILDEWLGWWTAQAPAPPLPDVPGLAARLKRGTEAAHAEAENVAFVKLLLKGEAPLEAYVALVAALRRVYGALERAADRCVGSCPVVLSPRGHSFDESRRMAAAATRTSRGDAGGRTWIFRESRRRRGKDVDSPRVAATPRHVNKSRRRRGKDVDIPRVAAAPRQGRG